MYKRQDREIVLSEADPDGWAAGGMYDNANMVFRNSEYYASYIASTYAGIEKLAMEYNMKAVSYTHLHTLRLPASYTFARLP